MKYSLQYNCSAHNKNEITIVQLFINMPQIDTDVKIKKVMRNI